MRITNYTIATISLVILDEQGQLLETRENGLEYMQGTGFLLPAVEAALNEREAGEVFQIRLSPEEAFGKRDECLRTTMPAALFRDSEIPLQIGETVLLDPSERPTGKKGQACKEWVIEAIQDDCIILDGNNPWAGKTLQIEVRVLGVRAATGRELWAGRAIPPDELARMGLLTSELSREACGPDCKWC